MATATAEPLLYEEEVADDERYGIYVLVEGEPRRVAATTKEGIGTTLVTLDEDRRAAGDEHPHVYGVLDRIERRWIASLWHPRGAR